MNADLVIRALLDLGWDAGERQRMLEILFYWADHPECEVELATFDEVRKTLRHDPGPADPVGGWNAFHERLRRVRSAPLRHWTRTGRGLAVAALVVLAVGITWSLSLLRIARPPAAPPPALAAFTSADIADRLTTFEQLDRVYDGRAGWLLLTSADAEIGLTAERPAAESRLLLLRLLVRRDAQPVARAELVLMVGQTAEVTIAATTGSAIHCRVDARGEDPRQFGLAVELCGRRAGDEALGVLQTTLPMRAGESVDVGEINTAGGAYRLSAALAEGHLPGT